MKTTARLDRVLVFPRDGSDRNDLVREMRGVVDGARLEEGGVAVPARSVADLLAASPALDLRWSEAARRYAENRTRALANHPTVKAEVERIKKGGAGLARELVADLDDMGVLDDHQVVNIAAMAVRDGAGVAVLDEQGAGKTVSLIFGYDLLSKRHEADLLIVVAPKSMVAEWVTDFARFKGDLYRVSLVSGTRREKVQALRRQADVYVMNYETVVSLEPELTSLARVRDGRAVLAVDESFFVKNLDAARTAALRRLREWCGRAYVLCGTPAPNSPHDLIQQFNIVDFGITFDALPIPEHRDLARPVVQAAIERSGVYVRHLKADVLPELPAKSFERVLCPLQPEQRRLYEGALRSLIVDLQAIDDETFRRQLTSFAARQMALRQVCSNPVAVYEGYDEVPAKLVALDALLPELVERRREKVVVWSFFRPSLEAIAARYARYGVVRYDGSVVEVAERREAVRRFQEDDETMVFLGNPAAAGAGLTLHRARFAVYESLSNQAAHYLQSLDRIHRRGQARGVEYLVLLADETLDLVEYDRLLDKERGAQQLLGDRVAEPVTRRSLLNDLQGSLALVGGGR